MWKARILKKGQFGELIQGPHLEAKGGWQRHREREREREKTSSVKGNQSEG